MHVGGGGEGIFSMLSTQEKESGGWQVNISAHVGLTGGGGRCLACGKVSDVR